MDLKTICLWLWTFAYDYEHCLWLWTLPMTMDIAYDYDCDHENYFHDYSLYLWLGSKTIVYDINGTTVIKHLWFMTRKVFKFCDCEPDYLSCLFFVFFGFRPWEFTYWVRSIHVLDPTPLFCLFLVLDLGNLPIKLGLPMFLNRRRYSTLFMPVSMSIFCIASLVHSLFSTNLALFII